MNIKKITAMILSFIMLMTMIGCGKKEDGKNNIVLLEGQFSEITILMEMAKILIEENTNLTVTMHDSMNTVAAGQALNSKEVDLYVGYDGTLMTTLLGHDPSDVPEGESLFNYVKKLGSEEMGLTLLEKFGFENTYALAIKEEYAQANNITTISELLPFAQGLVFGAEHEFFDEEGSMRYKPFTEYYSLEWMDNKSVELGLKFAAMDSGSMDATVVYSTDGLNKKSNLRVLKDDRSFFPEYFAAFMFRDTLFEEFKETAPNLQEVLSKLNGMIDNDTMIELNYAVDAEGQKPADIAKQFLLDRQIK